jgi:uncharacterized protein YbcC (UPF0753/DUF2309 family)
MIDTLARLLPAQGPISIFIHHNTLHAFEDRPFEEAVIHAGRVLGGEPFLAEPRYREKLASGRIRPIDVERLLRAELGARADTDVAATGSRFALWRAIVLHGLPAARGRELSWILEESPAIARDPRWQAALDAVRRAGVPPPPPAAPPVRHADALRASHQIDIDALVHPPLIRFLASYLDQGLAAWAMPGRQHGIHGCFLELYDTGLAARCGPWARTLPHLVSADRAARRSALASIAHTFDELGVPEAERRAYLEAELLALAGWAGIVRQIEERPDRVPVRDLTVTLRGYLAVRLLFVRAALDHAARHIGFTGPLPGFGAWLRDRQPAPAPPTATERAWALFHVAQLRDVDVATIESWTGESVAALEAELREIDSLRCRRILHQAFERTVRYRLYDALGQHDPRPLNAPPAFQAIFCLDEREESFRRHLEEVEPACETFGTAGFYNVAMYHRGATDAHPRPLCPVVIRPDHYVAEIDEDAGGLAARSRRLHRRAAGFLGYNVHVGSRTPLGGAVMMTAFGWLALVPLVLRVIFPWLAFHWHRARARTVAGSHTRLQIDRDTAPPPVGRYTGFTVPEMAAIVRQVLEDTGLRDRLSPLVLVFGHGSSSLNNPHESAYDCGACGGGHGGPNARAFAQMANDPRVRQLLGAAGVVISDHTWFVGGERNTATNRVTLFDDDRIPSSHRALVDRARAAIDATRLREAHERCRRFESAPLWYPPLAALTHVEGRATDLAQPRPECGHATNAFCVIGPRSRTRGLFLDRRCFLVSYDPGRDEDGAILARVIAATIPVMAGINLEYYFSYVDPARYGSGTKLPHNVTSLLGVMNGPQSDLRTGLPWQMVEIHEPVRLTVVIEAPQDRILRAVQSHPPTERLVRNRWLWLASLDPESGAVSELRAEGFVSRPPEQPLAAVTGDSSAWYQGRRGFLPPAAIIPAAS